MSYMLEQYRALFDKAYNEGVNANKYNNLPLAYRKLTEALKYAKYLAEADSVHGEFYSVRAEKIQNVLSSMEKSMVQKPISTPAPSGGSSGNGYPTSPSFGSSDGKSEIHSDEGKFYTFYSADTLNTSFADVVGLDDAKAAITEYVINPIKYPEAYNYNYASNKCILLEGPPGTGKTTFAKAVAMEVNQPFALVNTAALVNAYIGETAKNIDKVFDAMREYVRVNRCGLTIFFDEFDEIAKSRGGDDKTSHSAVPALLRNLDGMQDNKSFLIIANTNCADKLDSGILDRFRRKIHIPLPDVKLRKMLFYDKLKRNLEADYMEKLDFDALAEASEGHSGRSITQVCDDFLYFVSSVKAGIKSCDNYTEALLDIIKNK